MKKFSLFLALVFICLGGIALFFVPAAWLRSPSRTAATVSIQIPDQADVAVVARLLAQKKMISSTIGYRVYALLDASARSPRAGEYALQPGMSYRELARALARGPARNETSMTVIEGWTIADVQHALVSEQVDVRPSDFFAERFVTDFPFLKELPPQATLEGYLFPDTYRVWKDQLPDGLFRKQLEEFLLQTKGMPEEAAQQGRDWRDVVILASMVELEAKYDQDRSMIAGIFLNRIKRGMRLQSDATLNYILRTGRTSLNSEELKNESPYNTYVHFGLPPGPIGNPGKASLEAALHPTKTDDLYFLADKNGKSYFAKTLEEHNRNRQKVGL